MQANNELIQALTLNDEYNNERISENKEVDALFLAIDKYFCWSPFIEEMGGCGGENCVFEDFDEDVSSKYSFSTSGIGNSEFTINPSLISFGVKQ